MAGGADDDDTIMKAFDAFEVNGKIDADMFKHSLMTFGDKFSASEVDNAFGEFVIEDGMIDAVHLKGLMVSKKHDKLFSYCKYQSYHRHRHLKIRISLCHKRRAKKTLNKKCVTLQHASDDSFGKRCSFPQELLVKNNSGHKLQLQRKEDKFTNIANFYVTRNIILQ